MRIDLIYPTLPPAIDGIGGHTVLLAAALADRGHEVRILTRRRPQTPPGIPADVEVVPVWKEHGRPSVARVSAQASSSWSSSSSSTGGADSSPAWRRCSSGSA